MSYRFTDGTDTFEVYSGPPIDVTSNHRPNPTWRCVDSAGHEHRWHVNGAPAESYDPRLRYDVPTLETVSLGGLNEPSDIDEDYEPSYVTETRCKQCGQRVDPGYTVDECRTFIPGLQGFRINGRPVSKEEFDAHPSIVRVTRDKLTDHIRLLN